MNKYIKETLIWLVIILIALVVWYPVFRNVEYFRLGNGIFQIILILNLFRWFVFYDEVILFRRGWMKGVFILTTFTITSVLYIESLDSLRLFDDQALDELGRVKLKLNMQEIYDLFTYLKNLTMICSLGLLGATGMIIIKILYRSLGYGNEKVRKYLGK